ncbi:MAG: helix-turn-helix domain-containing protein [Clostridia bacterium]|nr:helix-turn-helix domain-containing protein [Clostridia bacterium]
MLRRVKRYFKSTFVRYIVSYLLLMALLVGGLTVYMYSYYRSSVYDSTISAEMSYAWQLKYSADAFLSRLDALARLVAARGPGAAEVAEYIDLISDEEEKDIFIYSAPDAAVWTPDGRVSAESWLNRLEYENLSEGRLSDELFRPEGLTIVETQRVVLDGAERRLLTISVPAAAGRYSVICMLPEEALLNIETAKEASESNRYIIFNSAITARHEPFSVSENKVLEAGSSVLGAVSEVKNLQGVNYLFIAVPGESDAVVYVSVQPLTGIRQKAAGVWLGFMAVLLALALPTTLFMVYISRKNLAPILEMGRHFGTGDNKYSDDISRIVSGIRELEGRNREILSGSLSARKHMFARNLVIGAFDSREDAASAAKELGLDIAKGRFAVLLTGAPRDTRQDVFLDSLIALAPEQVECVGTDLVENNQIMLIVFADEDKLISDYADLLTKERLTQALGLSVAMSAVHGDLKELSNAYLEATSAYESRFFMGENRLLSFSQIPFAAGSTEAVPDDLAKEIKNALTEGDMALVDKSLEKLRNTLTHENMNLFSFRQVYNDVISAIMSEAQAQQYTNADVYDLFSLSGCRSIEELEQVLRQVCESIISSREPEDELPLIRRVMRIMTVNYTDSEFTLTQAAELAGITPVRLSSEFKTKMGMTPMDYLTMLRMEEAKKLLRQTELNVSDVCLRAGYADASSFTRRFKQYAGVTPLQYRQASRKQQEG